MIKFYKIGGSVRDRLLGIPAHDNDWEVIGATAEDMIKLGYEPVGKDFPVFLHPTTKEEYSIGRKDISTGNKHTDYKFVTNKDITLEEATMRRDFSINTLAEDEDGKIIDFHGGINDLNNKIIRHINEENFKTDPLRVLRGCRFAAQLNFKIHKTTMKLFKQMVADGMLNHLTRERVWKELEKALHTPNFWKFIKALKICGALEVLFPEIYHMFLMPEKVEYHPYGNTGRHVIESLKAVDSLEFSDDEIFDKSMIRFAVLLHDIGKTQTPKDILPAHHKHEINGLPIIRYFCERLRVPKKYRDFALISSEYHMRFIKLPEITTKKQYDFVKIISDKFKSEKLLNSFLYVCRCDYFGESPQRIDSSLYFEAHDLFKKIYFIMENKTLKDLPETNQLFLDKHKNTSRYGDLYRQSMIDFLRKSMKVA